MEIDGNVLCPWGTPDENGTLTCSTSLPLGSYAIEATVKDLYDATDSTSIQLEIVEGGHPTVQFISPSEGSSFAVDQKIPFAVQYYDQEDLPTELDVRWESSLDGIIELESVGRIDHRWDFLWLSKFITR